MLHIGSKFRSKSWLGGWALGCVLLLAGSTVMWRQTHGKVYRTIRVGADNAAPYYTVQANGSVTGLAVDILNEAARRRNIHLDWIGVTDISLDQALFSRRVDLWPAVGSTQERQSRLHLTEPWLQARYCLLSKTESAVDTPRDAIGKRISLGPYPNTLRQAASSLPGAHLVSSASHNEVVKAVCLGKADAGFLDSRILDSVLLHRPLGCEFADFHIRFLQGVGHGLSIAAQKDLAGPAEALRAEISLMALDGSFSASLDKWSSFSAQETRSLFALREAEAQTRTHVYAMSFLVFTALLLCWQILKRRNAEKLLDSLAKLDPLTGLANRRYYGTELERTIIRARATGRSFALLYIDLDGFKQVNDTLGHSAGDLLLCNISSRLKEAVRSSDHLARIGGDEFTVVTGSLSCPDDAIELAEKILATFNDAFAMPTQEILMGASIGIALYPYDGTDSATLQIKADSAMYSSKNKGRKGFSFFAGEADCQGHVWKTDVPSFSHSA